MWGIRLCFVGSQDYSPDTPQSLAWWHFKDTNQLFQFHTHLTHLTFHSDDVHFTFGSDFCLFHLQVWPLVWTSSAFPKCHHECGNDDAHSTLCVHTEERAACAQQRTCIYWWVVRFSIHSHEYLKNWSKTSWTLNFINVMYSHAMKCFNSLQFFSFKLYMILFKEKGYFRVYFLKKHET